MKTIKTGVLLSIAVLFVMNCVASAQTKEKEYSELSLPDRFLSYSQLLSPEKLYLHTDREVYCVGDTIWFKGYLKNASALSEFPECNYIYVELLSAMVEKNYNTGMNVAVDDVRSRVKIKRRDDSFSGYVVVPDNLNTCIATLRAYSYWMLNYRANYMFFKNLEIRNPMKDDFVDNMVKSEVRDSYKYYDAGVENPFDRKKVEKLDYDVQFLPESGRYLYGKKSVIGVKAVDKNGVGAAVSGEIFADEASVATFVTNDLGMGVFQLKIDTPVKKLYAVVSDNGDFSKNVNLPLPESAGVVLNVKPDVSGVTIGITTEGLTLPDSTFVVLYDRSEIFFCEPVAKLSSRFKVNNENLSSGINNVAIVDKEGNVYAERAFFVLPQNDAEMTVTTDKEEYGPRERVICTVNGVKGNYSVSVSDDSYAPYKGTGYNVVSYYYLGSEIDSFVEDSQAYFDKSRPVAERIAGLDLVMMTQGWKYYNLPKIMTGETPMPGCGKEYTQSISGVVKGSFRVAKKSIVTFTAPSIGFSAMGELDTTGWFALHGLDFPDGTSFLVGAVGMNGSQRRFTPYLDDDIFARYHKYPTYLNKETKKLEYSDDYKFDALKDYYDAGGDLVYSLNPSYVSGVRSRRKENISPLPNFEFKEGQFRSKEELEPYSAYDLMDYIVTTCPPLRYNDQVPPGEGGNFTTGESEDGSSAAATDPSTETEPTTGRTIMCRTQKISSSMGISSGWSEILVFINGMSASCADLETMMVSDIEGFAYIKGSDAAMFNNGADAALAPRSVIMVKTIQLPHGIAVNVSSGKPIGWQKPAKVYNPQYTTYASRKATEEMRSTLYWNPNYNISSEADKKFDFFTSDHKVPYTVIIEGFTEQGTPVFARTQVQR